MKKSPTSPKKKRRFFTFAKPKLSPFKKKPKAVSFGSVTERKYGTVISAAAQPKFGVAIGIDWTFSGEVTVPVDLYEQNAKRSGSCKTYCRQAWPAKEREWLLLRLGFDGADVNAAKMATRQTNFLRVESVVEQEKQGSPSLNCDGLLSIESTALHSHGLDSHSRVLLCKFMTGKDPTIMSRRDLQRLRHELEREGKTFGLGKFEGGSFTGNNK